MEHSAFGRLFSVLVSPGKTFASIAERPTWLVALVVFSLLSLASTALMVPRVDWESEVRQQLAESGVDLDSAQAERQVEMGVKFGRGFSYFAFLFNWLLFPLLALVFWGAFKVHGSPMSFKTSLSTQLYGWMPWVVSAILSIPVIWGRDSLTTEEMQQGVLRADLRFLAPEGSEGLAALLGSMNLFSLWTLALLVIGYRTTARVSAGAAATWVVGLWLLYVLAKAGLTVLF